MIVENIYKYSKEEIKEEVILANPTLEEIASAIYSELDGKDITADLLFNAISERAELKKDALALALMIKHYAEAWYMHMDPYSNADMICSVIDEVLDAIEEDFVECPYEKEVI